MFGLASETVVKVVVGVVIGCVLVFNDYYQNFSVIHLALFLLQHWQRLVPQGSDRPGPRWDHAATSFTPSQLGNLLVVVGGIQSKDSWVFDMRIKIWERVSVTNNWAMTHALTHNTH